MMSSDLTEKQRKRLEDKRWECLKEAGEDIRYLSEDISNAIGHFDDLFFQQQKIICSLARIDYSECVVKTDCHDSYEIDASKLDKNEIATLAAEVVNYETRQMSLQIDYYLEQLATDMRKFNEFRAKSRRS
ncbi:hypothetical protein [Shewanella subflava]|uniref:Uncharacterized protein n=1 Tax=Shewanella subflava TaxID=2986476 RepID=A0ABT3I5N0_9GAMM|nr:hypothetical protein [Shewanella subflava]MCW3171245.1 hypothetical protein [Shewanella subflava]